MKRKRRRRQSQREKGKNNKKQNYEEDINHMLDWGNESPHFQFKHIKKKNNPEEHVKELTASDTNQNMGKQEAKIE